MDQEKVILEKKFPPGGEPRATGWRFPSPWSPRPWASRRARPPSPSRSGTAPGGTCSGAGPPTLSQEVVIDLVPITVAFQSVSHLLHAGGTGVIGYRLNKPAKESGVLSGRRTLSGLSPIPREARGNTWSCSRCPRRARRPSRRSWWPGPPRAQEVKQTVSLKVKPRKWRHDKLNLTDDFLRKVAASLPGVQSQRPPGQLTWRSTGRLRRKNHEKFRQVCSQSSPAAPVVRGLPALPGQTHGPLRRPADLSLPE